MKEKTTGNSKFLDEVIKDLKAADIVNVIGKAGSGKI